MIACYRLLRLVLLLLLALSPCHSDDSHHRESNHDHHKRDHTYDIPKHAVQKPLMDPIPTLPPVTHKVFLDVEIPFVSYKGRIVLGLFGGSHAPKMTENFRALCACDMGRGRRTGKDLCYKGSTIHRVIPNFMIQGGDFTHHDGTGGESIYGHDVEDESLDAVSHNRKFLLSSAHRGRRNSNGSQFFINTVKTQWLDPKHYVVFGIVLEGEETVLRIEKEGTNGGHPKRKINIVDSGVLELTEEDKEPILVARKEAKQEKA